MGQYPGPGGPPVTAIIGVLVEQPAIPIYVAAGGSSAVLVGMRCLLAGWSLRETSGSAAAVYELVNGPASGDMLAASIGLAASGMSAVWLGEEGVYCAGGIFLSIVSGSMKGAVYVRV